MSLFSSKSRTKQTTNNTTDIDTTNYNLVDNEGITLAGVSGTVNLTDGGAIDAIADTASQGFDFAENIFSKANDFTGESFDLISNVLGQVEDANRTNNELSKSAISSNMNLIGQANESGGDQIFTLLKYGGMFFAGFMLIKAFK